MGTRITLAIQTWTFYALSVSIIFARLIFRRIMLKSFADLQADDWTMVFVMLPFTVSIILINLVTDSAAPKQRQYRYLIEELQIVIMWLVKTCLLVLYWRIFPVAFSILRRRYVQVASAICILSFIITQTSLLSWCQPAHMRDDSQCATYHNHTIVSITFSTLTTLLVLILPTQFIPTPRRFLLALLTNTGILTLIIGTLARYSILVTPESQSYLFYYTSESTLLIVFANLPFLTSLVVSTTPTRIREFGRNISFSRDGLDTPLSSWPRSRRMTLQSIGIPSAGMSRFSSTVTVVSGRKEQKEWVISIPVSQPESAKCSVKFLGRPDNGRVYVPP